MINTLHLIKDMANQVKDCLERGNVTEVGEILHESWQYKKLLADGISSSFIDEAYAIARTEGAIGGKITGAGGGGFYAFLRTEKPNGGYKSA